MGKRAIWREAFRVVPSVSREEWGELGVLSRWLVSVRAAVLLMTLISCILAGLFALRDGGFRVLPWVLLTVGLLMGHAANNLFNDYTDFVRGVDVPGFKGVLTAIEGEAACFPISSFLPGGKEVLFPIDSFARTCLVEGVDELGYLLRFTKEIVAHETRHEA